MRDESLDESVNARPCDPPELLRLSAKPRAKRIKERRLGLDRSLRCRRLGELRGERSFLSRVEQDCESLLDESCVVLDDLVLGAEPRFGRELTEKSIGEAVDRSNVRRVERSESSVKY